MKSSHFLSLWIILTTWIRSIWPKSMRIGSTTLDFFGLTLLFFVSAVPAVLLSLSPQHQNLRLTFESSPRSSFSSFSSSKQPQLHEKKNPRKSTLVTVMCLCVYVCIYTCAQNRQIQSEMRWGKSRREGETEINYEPPCDFKFRYNTSG